MLSITIPGDVSLSALSAAAILKGPTKENETVSKVKHRLIQEEQREEEKREIEKMETLLEVRRQIEDSKRRGIETEQARLRADEWRRSQAQQREAIEKLKKEHAAQVEAEKGPGCPLRWPTRQELEETLERTRYDRSRFHFAIVGRAGSGKSSLINALRNLRDSDDEAVPTGMAKTALGTRRYLDPGRAPPRECMVWFGVPGAGMQLTPHQDYFVRQGLYLFDLIVLAIGDRFEESDARIIENCARFKIPTFIVRSKADMHILNSMKQYGDYARLSDNPTLYSACRDAFILDSQRTVTGGLVRQGLPDQAVYIVSRDVLQGTYNSALHRRGWSTDSAQQDQHVIHERHLAKLLLEAAAERRCDTEEGSATQNARGFVDDPLGGLFGDRNNERGRSEPAASNTARGKPAADVLKVIYSRKPTDGNELYSEMLRNDPNLGNMLVEKPRMFTTTVALLTFYPLAPVPREINAFGGMMPVKDYEERKKGGGAAAGGGRRGGGRGGGRGGRGGGGGGGGGGGEGGGREGRPTAQNRGGHTQTARGGSSSQGEGSNSNSNRTAEMGPGIRGRRGRGRGRA